MDTIVGGSDVAESPGYVEFERDGKAYKLQAIAQKDGSLWFVFRDGPAAGQPTAAPGSLTRRPAERRRRARLQQGDQPAVRVYPIRDLSAGSSPKPAQPGDRGRRTKYEPRGMK